MNTKLWLHSALKIWKESVIWDHYKTILISCIYYVLLKFFILQILELICWNIIVPSKNVVFEQNNFTCTFSIKMSGNFRFSSLAKLKIGPYRRRGPKIRPKHLQNTCAMHSFQFQCLDFLKEIIYCLLKMSSIWVLLENIF